MGGAVHGWLFSVTQLANMDASASVTISCNDCCGLKLVTELLMERSEGENSVQTSNHVGAIVANSLAWTIYDCESDNAN